jgi:hypothetical protein
MNEARAVDYSQRIENAVPELVTLLTLAELLRWDRPPSDVAKPALKRRAERPDPTADLACDADRLALSGQLDRSEFLLREALVRVLGVKVGLEKALARYGITPEDVVQITHQKALSV